MFKELGEPTLIDYAWFAGLFEGEGSIIVRKDGKGSKVRLHMGMTDYDVLQKVHSVFGGNLTGPYTFTQKRKDGNDKLPTYYWGIARRQHVLTILTGIYPHLGVRRRSKADEAYTVLGVDSHFKHHAPS